MIDRKRASIENMGLSFAVFEEDLLTGLETPSEAKANSPEFELQIKEIRIGCTFALLQCLERKYRLVYIIGEILEFDQTEASEILNLSKDNYRKMLERARDEIEKFTLKNCGVINFNNPCHCKNKIK